MRRILNGHGKSTRAVELPICPFCDGKVYYTSWVTHKIFQMECKGCGAHWRTGFKEGVEREMYVELTKPMSNGNRRELLAQKHPLAFWQNMITKRIKI